jgi:hypothetical protein
MGLKTSVPPGLMGRWYLRLTVNNAMGFDTFPQDDTNGLYQFSKCRLQITPPVYILSQ